MEALEGSAVAVGFERLSRGMPRTGLDDVSGLLAPRTQLSTFGQLLCGCTLFADVDI